MKLRSAEFSVGYEYACHWLKEQNLVSMFEPYWDSPAKLDIPRGDILWAVLIATDGSGKNVEISIPEIEANSPELFNYIKPFFGPFRTKPLWRGPDREIANPQDIGKA